MDTSMLQILAIIPRYDNVSTSDRCWSLKEVESAQSNWTVERTRSQTQRYWRKSLAESTQIMTVLISHTERPESHGEARSRLRRPEPRQCLVRRAGQIAVSYRRNASLSRNTIAAVDTTDTCTDEKPR